MEKCSPVTSAGKGKCSMPRKVWGISHDHGIKPIVIWRKGKKVRYGRLPDPITGELLPACEDCMKAKGFESDLETWPKAMPLECGLCGSGHVWF